MRTLETMQGKGTVTREDGQQVSVEYELRVYQEEIPVGTFDNPNASIPGLKHIEGWVRPVCFFGEELTLEMEDNRKLKFFFRDMDGAIALRHWIEKAAG